jgi:hypothetical protein
MQPPTIQRQSGLTRLCVDLAIGFYLCDYAPALERSDAPVEVWATASEVVGVPIDRARECVALFIGLAVASWPESELLDALGAIVATYGAMTPAIVYVAIAARLFRLRSRGSCPWRKRVLDGASRGAPNPDRAYRAEREHVQRYLNVHPVRARLGTPRAAALGIEALAYLELMAPEVMLDVVRGFRGRSVAALKLRAREVRAARRASAAQSADETREMATVSG